MKIYLVGGAVRDKLLNWPVKEKDWVVVGATAQDMLSRGYRQVGKDFPVFLHPTTNEEYALARTERKVGPGYTGFVFDASPTVTLEADLERRDLTINAMAETEAGDLIDPYHGRADVTNKVLRHVSAAFSEDPVRILRVGRFLARYAGLGFKVAPDTMALMKKMVTNGEVNALVAERVWKELERALAEQHPEQFFSVLAECGALAILIPSLNLDSHGMQTMTRVESALLRFAVLCHDYPPDQFDAFCKRYRVPSEFRELAKLVQQNLSSYQRTPTLQAEDIVLFLQKTDAFRREHRFKQFLQVCAVCSSDDFSRQWLAYYDAIKAIDVKSFTAGLKGPEIAERLFAERVKIISSELKKPSLT